ncbi:hypothetical protein [Elongatibacter sediminis]|uniref:Uncharacterized protein n=1 Tax=Elongatibacter sediminis TaxID=3119006 RepID=A0AAW9R580_9GAMM
MAVRVLGHLQAPASLKALVAVLLIGGFSPLLLAQGTFVNKDPETGETICDYDINADCRLLLQNRNKVERSPKESGPIDLTGYWMSVITEDWRWRVLTPPKGDVASLPLNVEGMRAANEWDPNDVGSCKPFGAAGLMRNPTRVRFQWEDENTLIAETDHGVQTRRFQFGATPPGPEHPHSLQGFSVASWGASGLKVETSHLSAGYLRKNGVPYSEGAKLTEYYNVYTAFDETWLTITTIVEDPKYLTRTFNTSLDFKKLEDDSDWNPTPCQAVAIVGSE